MWDYIPNCNSLIPDATLQTISATEWDIQLMFVAEGSC